MGFTGAIHTKEYRASHNRRGYKERVRRRALKTQAPERLGKKGNQRKLRASDRPSGRDLPSVIRKVTQDRPRSRENGDEEPTSSRQPTPETADPLIKMKKKEERRERRKAKQEKRRKERLEELQQIVAITAKAVATEIGHLLVKKGLTSSKKKKGSNVISRARPRL